MLPNQRPLVGTAWASSGIVPRARVGESGSTSPAWPSQVHGLDQSGHLPHAEASPGPPPSASRRGRIAHSLAHRTPISPSLQGQLVRCTVTGHPDCVSAPCSLSFPNFSLRGPLVRKPGMGGLGSGTKHTWTSSQLPTRSLGDLDKLLNHRSSAFSPETRGRYSLLVWGLREADTKAG